MNFKAIRGVLAAWMMKLCHKIVETQFTIMDPSLFRIARSNDTAETGEQSMQNGTCFMKSSLQNNDTLSSVTTWIYAARYMLPVLGGLLSCVWLGYVRVLQIGGVVMLLSSVLMSVSVYSGLMCQPSPIIPLTWLLLPLFYGLAQPGIVHGMFRWHMDDRISTVVSTLYYFNAVFGEWVALVTLPLSKATALGSNYSLIYVGVSVVFLGLSFVIPSNSADEPFEMPRQTRLIRYSQIFSGLTLFLISVADTRSTMYTMEITYFMNGTNPFNENSWLSPKFLNLMAMLASCLVLILLTFIRERQLSVEFRILLAIFLESSVTFSIMIFTAVGPVGSSSLVVAGYSVASIADGAAEVLIMVATYDLTQKITPKNSKTLIFGIIFTVWSLANLTSRCILLTLDRFLQAKTDEKPKFYIYHLITLAFLIICAAYHKFLALPLARPLIPIDDDSLESDSEEKPLLNPSHF